jgi:hypothetical protein
MTPPTKEAYYYRMIYEQHYPSMAAVCTVPQNKSIACSTEKAIEWDELFKKNADESGRAVLGIHATSGTDKAMDLSQSNKQNEMTEQSSTHEFKVTVDTRLSPIKKFK